VAGGRTVTRDALPGYTAARTSSQLHRAAEMRWGLLQLCTLKSWSWTALEAVPIGAASEFVIPAFGDRQCT